MRKITLVAAAVGTLFLVSCKKCAECHYDLGTSEVELGEYCGDDLEAIEGNGFVKDGVTYDVHCNDH